MPAHKLMLMLDSSGKHVYIPSVDIRCQANRTCLGGMQVQLYLSHLDISALLLPSLLSELRGVVLLPACSAVLSLAALPCYKALAASHK